MRAKLFLSTKENGIFVTLTFTNESINELSVLSEKPNQIATIAVRRFLERYRQKHKHSCKHWLITELGHKGTERVHLHGIIWGMSEKEVKEFWNYGFVFCGTYLSGKCATYVTKYITKIDLQHKEFNGKILCSKGIGKSYEGLLNQFKEDNTNELYTMKNGVKCELPTYYRNRFYNEEEKEFLWIQKLNKGIRWVDGVKVNAEDYKRIDKILEGARERNQRQGFLSRTYDQRIKDGYESIIQKINRETNKFKLIRKAKGDEKLYKKLLREFNKANQKC